MDPWRGWYEFLTGRVPPPPTELEQVDDGRPSFGDDILSLRDYSALLHLSARTGETMDASERRAFGLEAD